MTEFITENFWLILCIILMTASGAPGIACLTVAIKVVFGHVPGWLLLILGCVSESYHYYLIQTKAKAANLKALNFHFNVSEEEAREELENITK